ncbi:MAG: hypothetical protein D6679_10155 [Candidatus Hydrogenedentota bacterium]|nr:MAG: hypothetical protein D6679_10155 [Candidatus Hydrogenedentota bacterium]
MDDHSLKDVRAGVALHLDVMSRGGIILEEKKENVVRNGTPYLKKFFSVSDVAIHRLDPNQGAFLPAPSAEFVKARYDLVNLLVANRSANPLVLLLQTVD